MAPDGALYLGLDSSTQSLTAIVLEVDGRRGPRRARARRCRSTRRCRTTARATACCRTTIRRLPVVAVDVGRSARPDAGARRRAAVSIFAAGRHRRDRRSSTAASTSTTAPARGSRALRSGATAGRRRSRRCSRGRWRRSGWTRARGRVRGDRRGGGRRRARSRGTPARARSSASPAPQIRKFAHDEPEAYAANRAHPSRQLVPRLVARSAATRRIDPGDGVGHEPDGSRVARRGGRRPSTPPRPDLRARLPAIAPSSDRRRHAVAILAGAPSPAGRTVDRVVRRQPVQPGRRRAWCAKAGVAISLGTSDTIFGLMREPRVDPRGTGHVFGVADRRLSWASPSSATDRWRASASATRSA